MSIAVKVLYFAGLKDLMGKSEQAVVLDTNQDTVELLMAKLGRETPELGARLRSVRVAVNEIFVDLDKRLESGDVVALIPPVAGG